MLKRFRLRPPALVVSLGFAAVAASYILLGNSLRTLRVTSAVVVPAALVVVLFSIIGLHYVIRQSARPGWLPAEPPPGQGAYVIAVWDVSVSNIKSTWPWMGWAGTGPTQRWIGVFDRTTRHCLAVSPCPRLDADRYSPNRYARLLTIVEQMGFRAVAHPRYPCTPSAVVEVDADTDMKIVLPQLHVRGKSVLIPPAPVEFPPRWQDGHLVVDHPTVAR